jgi:3-oxoacyl-[acyl-carrier protein] reductase
VFDLTGKTALVTGASGDIGRAIATVLHRQGATVALSGTRAEVLGAVARSLGERTHVLPCNLADPEATQRLVGEAEAAMGSVDILITMPASRAIPSSCA